MAFDGIGRMAFLSKVLQGSLSRIWPRDLVAQVMSETTASARHFRSWLVQRRRFRGATNLKVNVGCAGNVEAGWVNIDPDGPPGVFRWDCRRSMPFDDDSVAVIFAEHVFEHFSPVAGERFLLECRRCLQTGGVLRIVVPDAGMYLRLYQGDWADLVAARPLVEGTEGYRDFWLKHVYRTKMELINEVFRQGTQHRYAYDADTLVMKMRDAGFGRVIHQSFGISEAAHLPLDSPLRRSESLYVEGIK
jgi:predicted SAM-dependent methyltransferase